MATMADAVLTAALTISGGIAVFGITQLLQRFWLEPVNALANAIGATAHALYYYAKVYANPGRGLDPKLQEETGWALRKVAADLAATANAVRLPALWRCLRLAPSHDGLDRAIGALTFISNGLVTGDGRENSRMADEACTALGIKKFGR